MSAPIPSWPLDRAGTALVALANAAGLPVRTATPPRSVGANATSSAFATWMEQAALSIGLEAEPLKSFYPDLDVHLSVAPPALFLIRSHSNEAHLVAVLRRSGNKFTVLGPDGSVQTSSIRELRAALLDGLHLEIVNASKATLDGIPLTAERRARAQALNDPVAQARRVGQLLAALVAANRAGI